MTTKKDFEIFLYKNKLNSKTLIDILPQLSSKTISNLYNDLEQLYKSKNTDKNTDKLYIFTDGGSSRNGKPECKAAYSVLFTEETESIMEPAIEKIKDIVANMPNENEEAIEELLKEIIPSAVPVLFTLRFSDKLILVLYQTLFLLEFFLHNQQH